ncbi:MAG: FAD-dependent oxidoreductase [Candidatus Caldatribacteriaceae bacterium]
MNFDVLILGGGVSGLKVAESLQGNSSVAVIEENAMAGGLAFQLGCKATSECLSCGVCRALSMQRRDRGFPIFSGRTILKIQKEAHGFSVRTDRETVESKFLVVATGASPFNAQEVPNLGWKKIPHVYTGFEMETALNQGILQKFAQYKKLAFVQCVGSRNFKEQRGYCSQVCCRYALRLAENLLYLCPQIKIDFYYMDLQILGKKTTKLREIVQKIHLLRKIPFEAREKNGKITLIFEDEGRVTGEEYEAVILSIGMVPSSGTQRIGEMLQLNFTPEGFIRDYGDGQTSQEGIFVCGTACGPKDIETSLYEAERVGQRLQSEMGRAKP